MGHQMDMIFVSCTVTVNGFALLINLSIVVMFLRFHKKLLSVNNNIFLFSMAIADFLVGTFGIVGSILMYLCENGSVNLKIIQLCGFFPLFGSFFMSILALIILTLNRLIALVYSLRYHSIMTNFRVKLVICLTWITVAIILLIQGAIFFGISWKIEVKIRAYQLAAFFILGTIILCTANRKLHSIVRSKRGGFSVSKTKDIDFPRQTIVVVNSISKQGKKMALMFSDGKICIWLAIIFIVCWLPLTVYYICLVNGKKAGGITTEYTICILFPTSNSFFNPLIYLINQKDFQKRFAELFLHCKGTKRM